MDNIKESDLYLPVKNYLESLGYDIKGEVKDCDITAVKDAELVVVELKKGFTIELLYQAIRRQKIADGVYLAIPLPKGGYKSPRYTDMLTLCKRLELGIIFVGFSSTEKPQIDVALHPAAAKSIRKDNKKRLAVLTEHTSRTGSLNTGGVNRRKILTQYKEQSLFICQILKENGPLKAEEIRKLGGSEKTSSILSKNFYKWYEKENDLKNRNTTYKITLDGEKALEEYKDLFD